MMAPIAMVSEAIPAAGRSIRNGNVSRPMASSTSSSVAASAIALLFGSPLLV